MNFVFISPNFPSIYSHFVKSLHDRGITVLGIGDAIYEELNQELKDNLTEYCQVTNMNNIEWMKNTLDYIEGKYGQIDYIESNNEYWLMNDSIYREYKHVPNGFYPSDMDKIKYKSKMKEYFAKANIKTARYILLDSFDDAVNFSNEVGFPLFIKPDNGVGASGTHKINNIDDLKHFFEFKDDDIYIIEEFIDGDIITFDGICDDDSNCVLMYNEIFPIPVANVVNDDLDDYYYANMEMDENFKNMGQRVIKSFGVKKRCFHIEFFKLKVDRPGLAKKGEIIGLEVNMRSPGGDTPDLLSISLNDSYYDVYADIIAFNKVKVNLNKQHFIAISVSRKNRFNYVHSNEEIYEKYRLNIVHHGFYDKAIVDAMGNEYWMGRFYHEKYALEFAKFIREKK